MANTLYSGVAQSYLALRSQILDINNLLTGVMTGQAVTLAHGLTISSGGLTVSGTITSSSTTVTGGFTVLSGGMSVGAPTGGNSSGNINITGSYLINGSSVLNSSGAYQAAWG